jgi:hypothetical protein
MLADILETPRNERWNRMAKTKDKSQVAIDVLAPYVKRAMEDPELRDDLLAAFVAARSLYGQLAKGSGVKGKAGKVTEKDFQKHLQQLVDDLSDASGRIQGKAKRSHKARNRMVLLTGVTLGVLYNPWTGEATRDWIMNRIAGENGSGLDDLGRDLGGAETGISSETTAES